MVENADTIMNTRLHGAVEFEKSELADTDAANTKVMTANQTDIDTFHVAEVHVQVAFSTAQECNTKLTLPMIASTISALRWEANGST